MTENIDGFAGRRMANTRGHTNSVWTSKDGTLRFSLTCLQTNSVYCGT